MGKIYGLLACIGTVAVVSGCAKAPQTKKNYAAETRATFEKLEAETQEIMKPLLEAEKKLQELQICRTKEADQKISEAAEANAVALALTAKVQDTTYINCEGKDLNVGQIQDESQGSVVITGPSVAKPITSVEISSDRTCAKLESDKVVADVKQTPDVPSLVVEADGDVKVPVSNSNLKLGIAMNITEGKNLLKLKYFSCTESIEGFGADGTISQVCTKKELVAEKEVVLNVTITKEVVEGNRRIEKCDKPKVKTADQE